MRAPGAAEPPGLAGPGAAAGRARRRERQLAGAPAPRAGIARVRDLLRQGPTARGKGPAVEVERPDREGHDAVAAQQGQVRPAASGPAPGGAEAGGIEVTAIRKHLRDFIAIMVLVVVALIATYIIVQQQRLRIPVLESKPFELKAEFSSAQAVVAGQGQTINVAGLEVGQVENFQLENGRAFVTFGIDRQYLPIYKDATILLRPRTGLQDMFFALDPGTKSSGEISDGGMVPVENTAPDVNVDEILAGLDTDTQ